MQMMPENANYNSFTGRRLAHFLLPQITEFFDIPAATQGKSFEWDHIVLVYRSIASSSGVGSRIDHFQLRC